MKRLLLLVLLLAGRIEAQELGVTLLGVMSKHFSCDTAREIFRDIPKMHIAALWGTFGNDKTCLDSLIQDAKEATIEIHALNGSCRRFHRCGAGEIAPSLSLSQFNYALAHFDPAVIRPYIHRLKQIKAYAGIHPDVRFIVSPELESNCSGYSCQVLFSLARRVLGPIPLSRSLVSDHSDSYGARFIELHKLEFNKPAHRCIADADGNTIDSLRAFIRSGSNCSYLRYWSCDLQGTCSGFKNPRSRRIRITRKRAIQLNRLLRGFYEREINQSS